MAPPPPPPHAAGDVEETASPPPPPAAARRRSGSPAAAARRRLPALLALAAALPAATRGQCSDTASWKSVYGETCDWYKEHDPGCTKYADVGQFANCNRTCGSCDGGSRPVPDPLGTTCGLEDLCACYEGCDPPELCPVADDAQACRLVLLTADLERDGSEVLTQQGDPPWLEWRLARAEEVHGVEVRGNSTTGAFVRTFSASWAGDDGVFAGVDGGRALPGSWQAELPARATFAEGPVQARTLRLYPGVVASGAPAAAAPAAAATFPFSAALVARRCSSTLARSTALGRCSSLKCRSFCHRHLGCDGDWEAYCELTLQSMAQAGPAEACDADCGRAAEPRGGLPWWLVPAAVGAALLLVGDC